MVGWFLRIPTFPAVTHLQEVTWFRLQVTDRQITDVPNGNLVNCQCCPKKTNLWLSWCCRMFVTYCSRCVLIHQYKVGECRIFAYLCRSEHRWTLNSFRLLFEGTMPYLTFSEKGTSSTQECPGWDNMLLPRRVFVPLGGCEPKNRGKTPKWMVKIMENPMHKWMIWG